MSRFSGPGPAGCAASITLARAGARVIMFDRLTKHDARRGETLAPEACMPLHQLGVWERFCAEAHLSSPGLVSVWGDPVPHHNDFAFNPYGGGWQLDRARFDRGLADAAADAGVVIRLGARVIPRRKARGGWRFDGSTRAETFSVRSNFAVDATGRAARLVRSLGHRRRIHDRLVGIVATIESPRVAGADRWSLVEAGAAGGTPRRSTAAATSPRS